MKEQAKAWRSPIFSHLEVLHATYRTHAFARHVHEDFCVGIIVVNRDYPHSLPIDLPAPTGFGSAAGLDDHAGTGQQFSLWK
ncbi:MAG: hypothetical protein WBG32_02990 [Nodosilinea sp.]